MPKGGRVKSALSALEELRQTLRSNPEFANWFGKSQAIDAQGNPLRVFHGTTKNFESFDPSLSNPEGDMGASLYFTDSPHDVSHNYAGEGQDLEGRIIERAERLAQENEIPYEDALHQANKEFRQNEGLVIPAYLRMENPVKIGGKDETVLDYEPVYDEDGEFTGDEKGSLVDFVLSLRSLAEQHGGNAEPAIGAVMEHAMDRGGIKASDLFDILNKDEELGYIDNNEGKIVSKDIVRQALQDAGFDSWIDRTPDLKWGTQSGRSKIMPHLQGTSHYGVFEPTQVKSAVGNRGTFDPNDPDITKARGGVVRFAKGGRSISELRNLAKFLKDSQAPRPLYHGTIHDIQEFSDFNPLWMTPHRKVASEYADRQAFGSAQEGLHEEVQDIDTFSPKYDKVEPSGQNVMPLHAAIKKPLDLTDMEAMNTVDEFIGMMQQRGFLHDVDESNYSDVVDEIAANLSTEDKLVDPNTDFVPTYRLLEAFNLYPEIRNAGYDGIRIMDVGPDGHTHESWAAFNPAQVKSAIGNEGTYDSANPNIAKARGGRVFAKGGKVTRTALDELKEYANALAPQKGFFSTLDKLVENAPFERGSIDQWRGYLKPGRTFEREGVQFPLKKEELDYAFENPMRVTFGSEGRPSYSREDVLQAIRTQRPKFSLYASFPDYHSDYREFFPLGGGPPANATLRNQTARTPGSAVLDPSLLGENRVQALAQNYTDWAHKSPGSRYEESVTGLSGLNYRTHYTADTLSHSRTTTHDVKGERDEEGKLLAPGKVRLIEEIQSDLHQDAAERPQVADYKLREYMTPEERKEFDVLGESAPNSAARARMDEIRQAAQKNVPRRGYRTPEAQARIEELNKAYAALQEGQNPSPELAATIQAGERNRLQNLVPDAPFKDVADYGRLEMRKQLLNAANNDEDYLAITNPEDQIERYSLEGSDAEAMHHIYGKVYRKEMEKLAKQYGAEMTEVPLKSVTEEVDTRPSTMQHWGEESMGALVDRLLHRDHLSDIDSDGGLLDELGFGTLEPGYQDVSEGVVRKVEKARELTQKLRAASDEQAQAQTMDDEDILKERLGWDPEDPDQDINAEYSRKELRQEISDFHQEHANRVQEARDALIEVLDDLYGDYNDVQKQQNVTTKTFPAIKLTPEVRERIKKAGVPLWSVGAGALGLEMLGHPDDASAEEPGYTTEGGFAEGGYVSSSLDELKDLAKRFGLGFSTQWSGLDPKGRARGAIYTDTEAPRSEWEWNAEANQYLPPQRAVKPGMIDDLASLPSLATTLATLGHYQGPQFSQDASKRSQDLDEALRSQMDVSPPEGVLQHAAEAAGSMFAQIPVPFEAPATESASVARRVLGPIAEWFSPTIKPSIANYAVGTGAGTALTMTIPKAIEKLEEIRNSDDPWRLAAKAAKNGELPPELAFQIAQYLSPQGDDMKFREEVPMHSDEENKEFADSF